jgi:hypothetical protein
MPKAAGGSPAAFIRSARTGSAPALAGLEHEGGACEGRQGEDEAEGLSYEEGLHHQSHRIPAPIDRAMDARSVRAQVKRARFAFTVCSLHAKDVALWRRQPGGLGEIPGFASPPRDGFALDDRSSGVT